MSKIDSSEDLRKIADAAARAAKSMKAMTAPRYTAREFDELAKAFDGVHGYAATFKALRQAAERERQHEAREKALTEFRAWLEQESQDYRTRSGHEASVWALAEFDRRFGRTP